MRHAGGHCLCADLRQCCAGSVLQGVWLRLPLLRLPLVLQLDLQGNVYPKLSPDVLSKHTVTPRRLCAC